MNYIMNRDRIDARTAYLSGVPDMKRRGNRYWARCPFHKEKTASFTVNAEKGLFYCFGCGACGDVVDFTMKLYGLNFINAAKRLGAIRPATVEERAQLWKDRQAAIKARREREFYLELERQVYLETRRTLHLLEAIAKHSGEMLSRATGDVAEMIAESMRLCFGLIREYAAIFSLLSFGPEHVRRDFVLRPEQRLFWVNELLAVGFTKDDLGRVRELVL